MTTTDKFRNRLNITLIATGITFFTTLAITTHAIVRMNETRIKEYLYPVVEDWTFRDWRLEEDGYWSAVVYINKIRGECEYVKDQIPTVLGIDITGEPMEAILAFIDDQSEGNSRPTGWQRLDNRVKITNENFLTGTVFRGVMLHNCGDEKPFITEYGPFVVGIETEFPDYVKLWIDSERVGRPSDYR